MRYQLISYLKFYFSSTNAHGVHSPFVYELVTKCFYDTSHYRAYDQLDSYRKKVLRSKQHLEVTDFGKGSRLFKNNKRRVSQIAKHAGIDARRQQLLYRLVRYFSMSGPASPAGRPQVGSESILELGTSVGLATAALALGNESATVHTVEGCPETSKVAEKLFAHFKWDHIQLHTMNFSEFFNNQASTSFDLVYVDGNHSKEHTIAYFNHLLPLVHNDTVLIFDDIYWSSEMSEAWEEIYRHEQVTVSIDSFYWGLVFFRKEQPKQHFRIRL